MKNVLLLTDFSPESNYAFNVALLMAQCSGGQLLLLHCLTQPTTVGTAPAASASGQADNQLLTNRLVLENHENIKRRLNSLVAQAHQLAPYVPVHQLIATAKLDVTVPEAIREHHIDLVVLGAHQTTSWKHFSLSGHTMQVMRDASCPVLTVKHPINGFALHHLVFASDFSVEADQTAPALHLLLELFPEANLHLIDVVPSAGHSDQALAAIHSFARRHELRHYEPDLFDAPRSDKRLPRFAEQDLTDFVMMLTHSHSTLGHILPGNSPTKAGRYAIPPLPKTPF